jgi:uncharacterized membrane protein
MFVSRKTIVRSGWLLFIVLNLVYFLYSSDFAYIWHDESFVLLHLSGHTVDELTAFLFDGQIKTTEALRQFQGVNPNRGFLDTIASLYTGSNYDLPLYYSLLWILAKVFGNSDLVLRGFSVLIWFGLLWGVYRLSDRLFQNTTIAGISVLLIFFSPRFTGYGLGIWEYGFYAFISALSSLWLLRALDSPRDIKPWIYYGLSTVAGLYTHVFYLFIFLAHILYFLIFRNSYNSVIQKRAIGVWIISFALYSFWASRIFRGGVSVFFWAKGRWSWETLWNRWINTIAGFFSDIPFLPAGVAIGVNYFYVVFIFIAFVYLWKKTDKKASILIILLTVMPFLGLLIIDLLLSYRYIAVGRFYLPSFIGIALAVSFLIYSGLRSYKVITSIFVAVLIIAGLIAKNPQPVAGVRFTGYGSNLPNAYSIINRSSRPLIIGHIWLNILPLINVAGERTEYFLVNSSIQIPLQNFQNQFSDIFVVSPSEDVKEKIERSGGKLQPTENSDLWKIER